ncbi:PREDICTED: uncharacterized protein LOC109192376 [Ipomoea nil]|uniref:uncharacterized protein LOC109192376 n=1 Tax=Ipomoea nil TaxID=35883 RepID=UPI0009014AC9|nr:PREDICTED: uncharacterized protein LOC109192376 [Ipomoea nil]
MATLERLCELAKMVRSGSILDVQGFLAQAHDQALAEEIIQALKECGLLHFCSFPYEGYYVEDVAEFYLMATVQGAVIISVVNGQRIEIREADIRNAFNLPESELDVENHGYDREELWNRIREEGTSEEKTLKPEFHRLVYIVCKCLDYRNCFRTIGTLISAIMQKIKFNWARFIFHTLVHFITIAKPLVNNMFKNYVGYGLLIGHLLKEKGVVLRNRKNVGNDRYLFKVVGRKRARTTSSKPVAVGANAQEDDPELLADLKRVKAWRSWRLAEYDAHCKIALEMKEEELFALNWLGTRGVAEAIRLVRINEVYLNKLGKKRDQQVAADKGKGKMPDVKREGEEQTEGILPKFTDPRVEKREKEMSDEDESGINKVLRLLVDSQNQLKSETERTSEKLILDMQQYFDDFLKKYKAEQLEFRKFIQSQNAELLSALHQQQNMINDVRAKLEDLKPILEDIRRQQLQNSGAIQFLYDAAIRGNVAFIPEEGVSQEAEEEESIIEST